jgi:hypothetical protein
MYTVRIRQQGPGRDFQVVVGNRDLQDVLNVLEHSPNICKYQVWAAGIGQCGQSSFSFGGLTKFVDGPLYENE